MGTNISKEGITKDLEAMADSGLEGAIIMHVYGFVPGKPLWPERTFHSPYWWEALRHAVKEANRLGLKLTLTNGAGWSGTNGPWIDETRSMRKLVWSSLKCGETAASELILPKPSQVPKAEKFYKDLAVLAVSDEKTVPMAQVLDVSAALKEKLGSLYGTSLNGLHVDSYECGDQNWSGAFMTAYPAWFLKHEPRPSARKTFTIPANYYNAESQPLPAGLMGPLRLLYEQRIDL